MNKKIVQALAMFISATIFMSTLPVSFAETELEQTDMPEVIAVEEEADFAASEAAETETAEQNDDIEVFSDAEESFFFKLSDLKADKYTENVTVGAVTLVTGAGVTVAGSNKTFDGAGKLTQCVKLDGKGELQFTSKYGGTVIVYAVSANSSDVRTMHVGKEDFDLDGNPKSCSATVEAGETVRIYGEKGINVYGINFESNSASPQTDSDWAKYVDSHITSADITADAVDFGAVTDNFTLADTYTCKYNDELSKEVSITQWVSSDTAVISLLGNTANVTRPRSHEQAKNVVLTATIAVGEEILTKSFIVTVTPLETPEGDEEFMLYAQKQIRELGFDPAKEKVVTGNMHLPTEITLADNTRIATVEWKSGDTNWVTDNGVIVQTPETAQAITMTATITAGALVVTETYNVVLKPASSVKAFPGAQGYGTQTRGGAKGYIYHVTSLGATGPGTLHEALEVKTGARTIVFDVGGTIDLTPLGRALKMSGEDDSNVTIAGQTAPGDGIQLKGYGMTISNVHDVIIRHISIRIGNVRKAGDTYQSDPLSATGSNKRVVLDHLSMCWAVDMGFRVYGNEMTMSNCMISKGLYWNTPHEKGKHNYAGIFGPKYGSFYGNYIADCGQRAPRICDNEFIDIRNNVVFNSKYTFDICNYEWMGANPKFNVVGNVVLKGNPAPGGSDSNTSEGGSYKYFQGRTYSGGLFVYSANNYDNTYSARAINSNDKMIEGALWTGDFAGNGKKAVSDELKVYNTSQYSNMTEPWRNMILPSDISLDEYDDSAISKKGNTLVNYPFVTPTMHTYSGADTVKYVLSNAGAKAPVRGILDNRYLAEARTRLQILSDYSKASKSYGIKLDNDYTGTEAYGLPVETHTVYEDENGITVYDVDSKMVVDASNMTVKEQYKFVSCENSLDSLYAIDKNGAKYRLELRDYTDEDDIYDAFELYDINGQKLQKPSDYSIPATKKDGKELKYKYMPFNDGSVELKFADWGDGAGNYEHKNSQVTDGNLDTTIVDTEWTEDDWPQLPTVYRDGKFDSNGDGIPDFFIKLMGWDKHSQYSPNKDISRLDFEGRGYTNLEYYINDYCAGDQEIADSEENNAIQAENVRDGSKKYNTHRSHEVLFNTARRAKAKVYYCEGEFNLASATEVKLNSEYGVNDKDYTDPNDYDTYFSAIISGGENGLKPNTTYTYKIKTYSDTGVECLSADTYSFKTLAESSGKPGTPRVLKYIPFDEQITLMFEPAAPEKTYSQTEMELDENDPDKKNQTTKHFITEISSNDYDIKTDHFVLRYSTNADMSGSKEITIPVTSTRYVLTGLSNSKEYYLDLRAVSADGTESDSAVYNKKKAQASDEKDKDGNDVYVVKSMSVSEDGKHLQEYYDDYEHELKEFPIQPTKYVVNEKYKETLKESGIGEGETTKFISIYGDEKDWYIYTLGGIPIPTTYENDDAPMLMMRDESHDHGFTYAKKFDTILDGKSTIHARLMIKDEELDPMNQSPELRFYIQQDSAAEEDDKKYDSDDEDDDDDTSDTEYIDDEEGGDNTATTFGNIVTLQFTKNEIIYNGGDSVSRYSDNEWYDIKFLMDADNGTCSLYINDSLVGKDMEYLASSTSNSIARWQISSRLAGTEDVYIDYMYAYKGWEEPVSDPNVTPKPNTTVEEGTSGLRPSVGGGSGGGGDTSDVKPTKNPEATANPETTSAPNNGTDDTNSSKNPSVNKASFTDMEGYEWAAEAVNELNSRGIAYGITEDIFAPAREITRAEFITLLMRGFELIGEDATCNFEDVPDGSWYYPAVAMASSMGVVNGYSSTVFGADDKVSRQDMAAIVVRLMSKLGFDIQKEKSYEGFEDDGLIADYAKDSVVKLYEAGIINGVGYNFFDPLGTTNRAAAAKILYSTLKIQWDKQES